MGKCLFLLSMLCWLISCGEFEASKGGELQSNKICTQNGVRRPCTQKEAEVIHDIQYIIDRIVSFDPKTFNQEFLSDEVKGNGPSHLYLLGEYHTDFEGQLKTWGWINYLAQNGGIVLLEGRSRKEKKETISWFFNSLISLYTVKEWSKSHKPEDYTPDSLINENFPLKEIVINNYNFNGLKLQELEFGYWDKSIVGDLNFKDLVKRNKSMVKAIFSNLPKIGNKPLFIIAGALHLPLGELHEFEALFPNIDFVKDYDAYYHFINENITDEKRKRNPKITLGSTEIIYRSLKEANIGFIQAIPKRRL